MSKCVIVQITISEGRVLIVSNSFQERLDRLALLYLEKHYDIKEMSTAEFIKTYNKVLEELALAMNNR